MKTTLPLPAQLDAKQANALATALLGMRGRPVGIDASRVEKVSSLALQVLLSARVTWASDSIALSIDKPSHAFQEAIDLLGMECLLRQEKKSA